MTTHALGAGLAQLAVSALGYGCMGLGGYAGPQRAGRRLDHSRGRRAGGDLLRHGRSVRPSERSLVGEALAPESAIRSSLRPSSASASGRTVRGAGSTAGPSTFAR